MTNREIFNAVLHFEKTDRIPNVEIGYWDETLIRWRKEGLPSSMPIYPEKGDQRYSRNSKELTEYFKLDAHDIAYNVSISDEPEPTLSSELIFEDEETETIKFSNGYMLKHLKSNKGIFHEMDWPVKSRSDWENIKMSYFPGWHAISVDSPDKLPSKDRDFAAMLNIPGFFWELRRWMGFENACTIFYEDDILAYEMLNFWGDFLLAQCKLVMEYYKPEYVQFDEDMAFNHGPMVSPEILKEFIVPQYKKVVSYINSKGVDVIGIESDGLIDEMIPVLYEAGVNMYCPYEIQCREGKDDLLSLGRKYPWLRMIGGVDKRALSLGNDAILREVSKIGALVKRGGYIPSVDHKVPPEVSLEAYMFYLKGKSKRCMEI